MFGRSKNKQPKQKAPSRPGPLGRWWEGMSPTARKAITQIYFLVIIAMVCGAGAAFGMKRMERHLQADKSGPTITSMKVTLVDVPSWLPARLSQEICAAITPKGVKPSDNDLARKVYELAGANPWVRKVHEAVRVTDADPRVANVQVKADYRMAVAQVQPQAGRGGPYFVDNQAVRLPAEQVARYFVTVPAAEGKPSRQVFFIRQSDVAKGWPLSAIHFMIIDGVAAAAPPVGQKWPGKDLEEGLQLLSVLATRTYANQIMTIDVRNFENRANRRDPALCLRAKVGDGPETLIKFGRFTNLRADFEIPVQQKMECLDAYVSAQGGKLAGTNNYVDLRWEGDRVSYMPFGK